jgi:hypothetical protein
METKFNFKSQICTNREQSERLLSLGLKRETADMVLTEYSDGIWRPSLVFDNGEDEDGYDTSLHMEILPNDIPAWSLHRLIEMMPDIIKDRIDEMLYHLSIAGNSVFYENRSFDLCQFFGNSLYDCIIDCIEWLIKKGDFNKEYLVNQEEIEEHCKGVLEYLDYIRGEEEIKLTK